MGFWTHPFAQRRLQTHTPVSEELQFAKPRDVPGQLRHRLNHSRSQLKTTHMVSFRMVGRQKHESARSSVFLPPVLPWQALIWKSRRRKVHKSFQHEGLRTLWADVAAKLFPQNMKRKLDVAKKCGIATGCNKTHWHGCTQNSIRQEVLQVFPVTRNRSWKQYAVVAVQRDVSWKVQNKM